MFISIVKIILFSSILGMGIIIFRALPRLAALETGERSGEKDFSSVLKRGFSSVKTGGKKSVRFVFKNISSLKNSTIKNLKEEAPKLSSGYWEKIRKGKQF